MTRIEQIRQREQQATKGPWIAEDIGAGTVAVGVVAASGSVIVEHDFVSVSNAEFIAHAREDIPHLLKLWDTRDAALRTLVEQWRAKVDEIVFEDGAHVQERCDGYIDCADALDAILKETTHGPENSDRP